ncbi:MAG: hypothetical protein QM802_26475 [Agriterribacter sp.]
MAKNIIKELNFNELVEESGKILRLSDIWMKIISKKLDDGKIQNEKSFMQWFKANFVCIPFYLTSLFSVVIILSEVFPGHIEVSKFAYIFEAFVIFVILINIVFVNKNYNFNRSNEIINRGIDSAKTFLSYWVWLWVSWFLLYAILALNQFAPTLLHDYTYRALIDACNNLSGVIFFSMYFELANDTQGENAGQGKSWLIGILLVFILFLLEVIVLKNVLTDDKQKNGKYIFQFSLWFGLAIGVVTGLFVGRLESIMFNIPTFFISYFILYSVIQPTFAFLGNDDYKGLSNSLLIMALYGKIFLLIIIHWVRDSDRLLYYVIRRHKLFLEETKYDFRKIFLNVIAEYANSENNNLPLEPVKDDQAQTG